MIKNWVLYILALLGGMLFFTFYQMWFAWYCLIILLLIPPLALLMSRKLHICHLPVMCFIYTENVIAGSMPVICGVSK